MMTMFSVALSVYVGIFVGSQFVGLFLKKS